MQSLWLGSVIHSEIVVSRLGCNDEEEYWLSAFLLPYTPNSTGIRNMKTQAASYILPAPCGISIETVARTYGYIFGVVAFGACSAV